MAKHCCTPARAEGESPEQREVRCGGSATTLPIAGGRFLMGSADPEAYPEDREGPVRQVDVEPFEIGATTVTVAEFAEFVGVTRYVTDAEQFGDSLVFVGALPDADDSPVLAATPWWRVVTGADWRRPSGPASSAVPDHPVTHVSRRDAAAYCAWTDTVLPTEAEWEFAARGGLVQQPFPWGSERYRDGREQMNVWQGEFPGNDSDAVYTQPARSHAANGFGLYNCTGNVWEWTTGVFDPLRRDERGVIRGGSYLCHDSYCRRYRTSARSGVTVDTSSGHIGFRVVRRPGTA
ncbi:formylglycine-generating enzyme family protein [Antrihabitans cavernicola]|uniref:Formylglycine-generating enzyme family protein n=1 Tax=Antrihabitans cavernicola TaxID=2495913 RepID=A0A5A7S7L2_9NOCA|nr:formylglycine-generating enzyme family protein [Spelaeibacter cavernicola]KAA0018971.1 formylglycine-generating enzyme family protein [Spelaeibacter cavernicola]